MKNKKLREQMKSYIIVTLACVLYALSFDWFYAPNGFTVGGFTGISQIINFFAPILPVGTMVIVLNVPLFIVGLKKFGFAFLCKSIYTMTLSSILIDVVAAIHEFAPMDPLLACLYGGVTLLNGKGGYTGAERPLLFCAIRKKEAVSIKRYIKELDPDAFFIVCDASEVLGEGFGEYDPQGL